MIRRPLFSTPEEFSVSPLLSLLPQMGSVGRLASLTPSLLARYEKVSGLHKGLVDSADRSALKKVVAEEAMLRQVLEWLDVKV